MKYARYSHNGSERYGIVDGEELIELDGSVLNAPVETGLRYPVSTVKLLPPIMPTKIVCIGQNYIEHIKEIGATPPEEPLYFLKPPSSLIGPGDAIVYPKTATRVDYEGELAVVIKKTMKDVPKEKAKQYILGYSCFNDVTERDLVAKNPFNLTISKSFDTFSAFGPYIVTDIDPDNLQVKTYLNGELMQDDNTSECVFNAEMPHTLPRRHCDHRNTNSLRHGLENMPSAIRGLSAVAPGAGLVESDALKRCSWGFLRTATEPHTLAHQLRQKGNYHVSE